MSFPQYTTPTVSLTFTDEDLDLTAATNVYVTFKSSKTEITKTGTDLTVAEKQIDVKLSQAETGSLGTGGIQIQANWTDATGGRAASNIVTYDISKQLLQRVVE